MAAGLALTGSGAPSETSSSSGSGLLLLALAAVDLLGAALKALSGKVGC